MFTLTLQITSQTSPTASEFGQVAVSPLLVQLYVYLTNNLHISLVPEQPLHKRGRLLSQIHLRAIPSAKQTVIQMETKMVQMGQPRKPVCFLIVLFLISLIVSLEPYIYDLADDDIDETEDLLVLGESQEDEDEEELPVRILYDFTIYRSDTMEVIPVAELLLLSYSQNFKFQASGLVRPWVDLSADDSDSSEDDSEGGDQEAILSDKGRDRVSLSKLLEFNVHAQSEGDCPIDPYVP